MRALRQALRTAWALLAIVPLVLSSACLNPNQPLPTTIDEPPDIGFTFSSLQADYLEVPWRPAFEASLELAPSLVRLAAYWNEIEPRPGEYDFSTLDWLIERAASRQVPVLLVVGMKAPRWPEYHLPSWLNQQLSLPEGATVSESPVVREQTLQFIRQVVLRYRATEIVRFWQVENEPLTSTGPHNWRIGADFLAEEVELVRALDPLGRPIVINMFVYTNPLAIAAPWHQETEGRAGVILELADILGLDVYTSRGFDVLGRDVYLDWSIWRWEQEVLELRYRAERAGKVAWITEAQAEPWEPSEIVHTAPAPSRSVTPSTAAYTLTRLQALGLPTVLLWGVEHWYMRLVRYEDARWWSALGPFPFFSRLAPPYPRAVRLFPTD